MEVKGAGHDIAHTHFHRKTGEVEASISLLHDALDVHN